MASTALRGEERIGLILAIAAHAALLALLLYSPLRPSPIPPPGRMTVTLSDQVGLTSTSPEPQAQAAPDEAPMIGEVPEPEPAAQPLPEPAPIPKPQPRAAPVPQPKAAPRPSPSAKPNPAPSPKASPRPPVKKPGASRIGSDFLPGVPGAQTTGQSRNPPAAVAGPAVQAALAGAISRQLKPRWAAPQGAEAEKLITILAWSLNRDGTLAGAPRVVRQEGITDANRPQAPRHAEQAIRAVQLAAPFDLPQEYYDAWKRVGSFRFDRRLSQ